MALALPSTFLKNLDKKLFGFQVFNGLRYGFMLLASILLTHVATQTEVNTIETLLLVGATATFFFSSSIGHTLVSFAQRFTGEDKAKTYFNAFLLLTSLTFVAILCLLIIQQFAQFTDNNVFYGYTIFLFINVITGVSEIILLIEKKTKELVGYGVAFYTLYLLAFVLPFFLGYGLEEFLISINILALIKLMYTLTVLKRFAQFQLESTLLFEFLRLNLPVMASYLMGSAVAYFSFFLVKYNYSDMEFNLYRYGLREFPLFLVLANSFSTFISGDVSKRLSEKDSDVLVSYRAKLKRLQHQLFIPAILLMLSSAYLFQWLLADAYEPAYLIFNVFLFTVCSRVLFPQSLLVAYGVNKAMYLASFLELATGAVLSYFWLAHGLEGMAWALVIAFFVEKLVLLIACERLGIPFLKNHPWKEYLAYTAILILSFVLF
jgi:hypothetical protein